MKLLLTNDDGIDGEGLKVLAEALRESGHEVTVFAPDCNNSAVSHKITMFSPVRAEKVDFNGIEAYAVSGSPADCVLLAVCGFFVKPDMVISGINCGINLGSDVIYSGTVAGAMEGAQNGIPSLALSLGIRSRHTEIERSAFFARAASLTIEKLEEWANLAREVEGIVNVNFPVTEPKGYRFCSASRTNYQTAYEEEEGGYRMRFNPPAPSEADGDIPLFCDGYVTVTPLKLNLTDEKTLERWQK